MKKEVAEKWVAALRSGKYKQGTGRLRADGRHCCWGVLAELATEEGIEDRHLPDGAFVHKTTREWAGIENGIIGYVKAPYKWAVQVGVVDLWRSFEEDALVDTSLVTLNDCGATFEQIAVIIEDQWENL